MPYKDPEKRRERDRAYRKKNAAKIAAYNREWHKCNRDKVNAKHRRYYRANPEKTMERAKRYRQANPEPSRASCRQWRAKNGARVHELNQAWKRDNPEKYKAAVRQSNLRKRGARGRATDVQIEARIALYGGMCSWCGEKTYEHIDHVIALANGGTNWPANLRPACRRCNQRKNKHDWSKRKPIFP